MLKIGSIYSSNNCGDFKIVSYKNSKNVGIEFLSTGYKTNIESKRANDGSVKDKLHPSVFGIGFFGDSTYKASVGGRITKSYNTWSSMLERCYGSEGLRRNPSYLHCTVCEEWHNFQNFAKWFYENRIEGFHIDKDIKQRGVKNKVYSPETCIFVSLADNSIESQAKRYKVRDPDGLIHEVYNMADFVRKNNLRHSKMSLVCSGKRKHHKGWTKA